MRNLGSVLVSPARVAIIRAVSNPPTAPGAASKNPAPPLTELAYTTAQREMTWTELKQQVEGLLLRKGIRKRPISDGSFLWHIRELERIGVLHKAQSASSSQEGYLLTEYGAKMFDWLQIAEKAVRAR